MGIVWIQLYSLAAHAGARLHCVVMLSITTIIKSMTGNISACSGYIVQCSAVSGGIGWYPAAIERYYKGTAQRTGGTFWYRLCGVGMYRMCPLFYRFCRNIGLFALNSLQLPIDFLLYIGYYIRKGE